MTVRQVFCGRPLVLQHDSGIQVTPVSKMTYTVSSGTLNSSIPYHTIHVQVWRQAIIVRGLPISASNKIQKIFPSVLWHCRFGDRNDIRPGKSWELVVTIWLELCTSCSSTCHHHGTTSIIFGSTIKIQDGEISVPANAGPPGQMAVITHREKDGIRIAKNDIVTLVKSRTTLDLTSLLSTGSTTLSLSFFTSSTDNVHNTNKVMFLSTSVCLSVC